MGSGALTFPRTPGGGHSPPRPQLRGPQSSYRDAADAAMAPGESAAAAPPSPRRPALERSFIRRMAGRTGRADGRCAAPGAGYLSSGVSSRLARQVVRDAGAPYALVGRSQPADRPGSVAVRRADDSTGAARTGYRGGQPLLSGGTRPDGRRTRGGGRGLQRP